MAKQKNIPVIGLAGQIPSVTPAELEKYFDVLLSINNELVDISRAMANTSQNLKRTAKLAGNLLALKM